MLSHVPDVLNLKELQKILHIGRNTALKLIHEEKLDAHFIAGKWLILREDVEEFLKRM